MKNLFSRIKQIFNPVYQTTVSSPRKKAGETHFLVVEDNKVNQLLVRNTLRKAGITFIDFAENGKEAIEKTRGKSYDIILMDIMLPDMKGYDVALKIRNNLKIDSSKTKIIALTAEPPIKDRENAMRSGMDNFLMKPYAQEDLFKILENYIDTGTDYSGIVSPTNREDHFNIGVLEKYSGGDEQLKQKLIELFLEELPELLNQLSIHIENKDTVQGYAVAHKLKNNISMLEVPSLTEKMQTLEINLQEGKNYDDLKSIFQFIQTRTMEIVDQMRISSGK